METSLPCRNDQLRKQVIALAARVHDLENNSKLDAVRQELRPVVDETRKLVGLMGLAGLSKGQLQDARETATKVFNVPELLEMILLKLEPRDVFVAMQVCRQFRDITNNSIALQRHLFLACDSDLT